SGSSVWGGPRVTTINAPFKDPKCEQIKRVCAQPDERCKDEHRPKPECFRVAIPKAEPIIAPENKNAAPQHQAHRANEGPESWNHPFVMTIKILEQKQEGQIDQPDGQSKDHCEIENNQPGTDRTKNAAEKADCQKHREERQ
ncbi:MAG: hypothetical protein WCC73_14345, partial [Terracidiphilus sp.]